MGQSESWKPVLDRSARCVVDRILSSMDRHDIQILVTAMARLIGGAAFRLGGY